MPRLQWNNKKKRFEEVPETAGDAVAMALRACCYWLIMAPALPLIGLCIYLNEKEERKKS